MITACQPGTLPRTDNNDSETAAITTVTLKQDFPIRPDRSNEYIQDGKISFYEAISEYHPHCKLELRTIADTERVIHPETFSVTRVYRQEDFVGYKKMIFAGDGDSGQIMSTTYLFLHSEKQPAIFRLSCMRLDESFYARHVTVDEMRDTLGDLMTFSLQGAE
ncbi:MAG: hypothetical protein ABFS24_04785 [Pseudomonadota bacterium]